MLAKVASYGLIGIEGFAVQVEVDVSNGLPAYETVGLPDAAVRESKERVRAAIRNSGMLYPNSRITIGLAPADMRKEGSVYDLPIAVGLLAATGQLPGGPISNCLYLGELALDGSVRGVVGVLPMLIAALQNGFTRAVVPYDNVGEAAYLEGLEVYPVRSLREAAALNESLPAPYPHKVWSAQGVSYDTDFASIKGQQGAKRAAEVAVAGGHNLLLVGTPGSGKTMLARALPGILPDLTLEEALCITKIHSAAGSLRGSGILQARPFRAPHHSASSVSLVGGGQRVMPGEVSLAHYGV